MLTPKKEKFARVWVETGNASEAYRQAFDVTTENIETIAKNAQKYSNDPDVIKVADRLKREIGRKHDITITKLLEELEQARVAALHQEKPPASAMVAATMGKARLTGLDKQIIEMNLTPPALIINRHGFKPQEVEDTDNDGA